MRAAKVVRIPNPFQRPTRPALPKEECGTVLIWMGVQRERTKD